MFKIKVQVFKIDQNAKFILHHAGSALVVLNKTEEKLYFMFNST